MKALFLVKSMKTPSSRIRMLDMFPELERMGIVCEQRSLAENIVQRCRTFRDCRNYDAVVFQKKLLNKVEFAILRRHCSFLIFDYDDAIYHRDASPSPNREDYLDKSRERKFRRTVEGCDIVVAANNVLAEKALEFVPESRIRTIPSPVKLDELPFRKDTDIKGPPVVGWVGMKGNLIFLKYIAGALCELARKQDYILRIISDEPADIPGVRTEFVKWTLEGQNLGICSFDIGIMPLSPDPYSEGKSSYKLIQYLAAGVPSICSPVGMNLDFCAGDEYALSAEKPADFAEKILLLVKNDQLRARLSSSGRGLVKMKFDIRVVAESYARVLREGAGPKK